MIHKILDLSAWILPAYAGYCESKGITIDPETLKSAILYGPTVLKAAAEGIEGVIVGAVGGAVGGGMVSERLSGVATGGLVGAVSIGALGAAAGTVTGGARSLVSYYAGRIAGEIF
jgi:hypothetical protein